MKRLAFALVAAVAVLAVACGNDSYDQPTSTGTLTATFAGSPPGVTLPPGVSGTPQSLPEAALSFETDGGVIEMTVEVADDGAELSVGLMFRESMAEDAGMLFDFGEESVRSFHMRNTLIPLSLAFMTADGTIIDIQDMEPLSEESHVSPAPVAYGLEVNQGWFERNGVAVGDVMTIVGG